MSFFQKLTITFVIPYFYPAWQYGGQPRAAYEIARGLAQRGHRVRVLTTDSEGSSRLPPSVTGSGPRLIDGIEVHYYRNISNYLAYRQRLFWPPSLFREIRTHLSDTDIVHIHEFRSPLSVAASHASRVAGIPFVLSPHGGIRHLGRGRIKTIYDLVWGKSILRRASGIIAVSPIEVSDIRTFGVAPGKISELPNTIDFTGYRHDAVRGRFRQKWNLRDHKVALFLGRLNWIKGADLLVDAFSELGHREDTRLVIAGPDDGQQAELQRLVMKLGLGNRVIFTGYCANEDKLDAFVDADILVVPSRSEVFAMTVVEALACGCPVLLSSACGLHPMPLASDGVIRFDIESRKDLVSKLLDVLTDSSLRSAAASGAQFVRRAFSADTISRRAEMIYYRILGIGEDSI